MCFLLCWLYSLKCILAFMYIPPPCNSQPLRLLFQLRYPEVPLFVMGDFTCYIDPDLNKHPPVTTGIGTRTALKKLMDEVCWLDPWRAKHPRTKQFSCFSKSYSSLARIDLCLCSLTAERYVLGIQYDLRIISDHSPLIVQLEVHPPSSLVKATWKLNAF